jgi:hypothetical protein
MRKIAIAAMVLIVGIVAAYLVSPYWTLYQIRSAATAGEGDQVATYVDFPAVRESIKSQFVLATVKRMESKGKDSAFATLGQAFALRMIDGFIDALVSPEGIANMIRSGKAPRPTLEAKATPATASTAERREPKVRRGYEGLDTFQAAMVDPESGEDMLTAVLSRQGLFTWKLTAVRIPGLISR